MKFYLMTIGLSIGWFIGVLHTHNITKAETELSKTLDCTEIELEAIVDQNQTREENLKRLSQQFFDSINKIEHCDRKASEDSTSTAQTNNLRAEASDNQLSKQSPFESSDDKETKTSLQNSQNENDKPILEKSIDNEKSEADNRGDYTASASSSLIGTNVKAGSASVEATAVSGMSGMSINPPKTQTQNAQPKFDEVNNPQEQKELKLTNGKIPDDIPAKDNDSAFEAQIRAAAVAETNPDIQKKLWNEYRRYKGLPEKE